MTKKKQTNRPIKKRVNKRTAWFKVARKVHRLSKEQNLGWTWNESVKFASKNIYPEFKGKKQAEIKVAEITDSFNEKTSISTTTTTPTGVVAKKTVQCYSALQIPTEDLQEREWYFIADDYVWVNFPSNLPMRFAFDGIIDTDIIMKSEMPNMQDIREKMRAMNFKYEIFIFKVLVAPNKKDDGNPCSYYVLVTIADSYYDNEDEPEIFTSVKEDMLSEESKKLREQKIQEALAQKQAKTTKKQAKARVRPTQVEPTVQPEDVKAKTITTNIDLEKAKIEKERVSSLTEALNIIRQDYKEGILTKRRYIELQKKIIDKFEKGGKL